MKLFEDHPNYNCTITTDTGSQHRVFANWMHNNKLDIWQGWHCSAGETRFYIDKNFDIWDGECQNTLLGNVLGDWDINSDTICSRKTCTGCTDDLMAEKYERQ